MPKYFELFSKINKQLQLLMFAQKYQKLHANKLQFWWMISKPSVLYLMMKRAKFEGVYTGC